MAEDWQAGGFGLYVHWPFCAAKCPYCDFNSHVSASVDHAAWARELVAEVHRVGTLTKGRVLRSVFFGGGTPSLMDPRTVEAILNAVGETWPLANDVEVTLEANPTSVEAQRFAEFRTAGVNRVSMGIQALDDSDLKRLGRMHTAAEALAAFDIARRTFERVSFDLMYGRQDQSLTQWESELSHALRLGLDHVSLYQLTIEDGTAFGARYKAGKFAGLPDDDLSADMFELTHQITADHGLRRYEVSNHARDGAESRHNLIYWRYGDYAGIGPGAHGRLTLDGVKYATEQVRMPAAWLEKTARERREPLTGPEQATELLLMGLRLTEGIDLARYALLAGQPLDPDRLAEMQSDGLVDIQDCRLFVPQDKTSLLNAILARLLD